MIVRVPKTQLESRARHNGRTWADVAPSVIREVGADVDVDTTHAAFPKPRRKPEPPPSPPLSPLVPRERAGVAGGPVAWHMLHSRARRPIADKAAFSRWLDGLAGTCGTCAANWRLRLQQSPPPLESVEAMTAWALAEHNIVRVSQGKAAWPASDRLDPRPIRFKDSAGQPVSVHNRERDKAAVLACNGPSLASMDWSAFAGLDIMAVNNAAKIVRPRYWVSGDPAAHFPAAIFDDPTITKFFPHNRRKETAAGGSAPVMESPSMIYTTVDDAFDPATWLAKTVIAWGRDKLRMSLVIGLRVLIDLGYRTIYLVGCDWHMDEQRPYASDDGKDAAGVRLNNGLYATWGERFAALERSGELEAHGVSTINATLQTKLAAWKSSNPKHDGIDRGYVLPSRPDTPFQCDKLRLNARACKPIKRELSSDYSHFRPKMTHSRRAYEARGWRFDPSRLQSSQTFPDALRVSPGGRNE